MALKWRIIVELIFLLRNQNAVLKFYDDYFLCFCRVPNYCCWLIIFLLLFALYAVEINYGANGVGNQQIIYFNRQLTGNNQQLGLKSDSLALSKLII